MQHRYLCFLICIILTAQLALRAQITADSVPPGMFSVNPNVALSVSPCTSYDSTIIDINCDGNTDFSLILYKGATVIDGANVAYLRIVNDSFEICKDTGGMVSGYARPHYYNAGDPLVPAANSMWGNDAWYQFGDYGCMMCSGPASQTNKYIAYRKQGQVGWMKLSFALSDGGSCVALITLTVHAVLSSCLADGISENEDRGFVLYPNPFGTTTTVTMQQTLTNGTLTIYNATGECVKHQSGLRGSTFYIDRAGLPDGMYLFTFSDENGVVSTRRVMIAGE